MKLEDILKMMGYQLARNKKGLILIDSDMKFYNSVVRNGRVIFGIGDGVFSFSLEDGKISSFNLIKENYNLAVSGDNVFLDLNFTEEEKQIDLTISDSGIECGLISDEYNQYVRYEDEKYGSEETFYEYGCYMQDKIDQVVLQTLADCDDVYFLERNRHLEGAFKKDWAQNYARGQVFASPARDHIEKVVSEFESIIPGITSYLDNKSIIFRLWNSIDKAYKDADSLRNIRSMSKYIKK